MGGRYAKEVSRGLCDQEILQYDGDEWLVGVTYMEAVSTETDNCIIDEVGGSSVDVFEGSDIFAWVGMLCVIYRVDPTFHSRVRLFS